MIIQLTVVPPPSARPCSIETDRSSVVRAPRSAKRRSVISPSFSEKSSGA
jgi:hypothetical protein